MEEFWNVAQRAMDLAVETAESVSKRGKDFAADSAEEATRQFRSLQERQMAFVASRTKRSDESIADRVVREDMQREMEEYGINDAYIEAVKQLDYSAFRDFHQSAEQSTESEEKKLNKWQERHALLLVKNVKEIDELRFVLCPKYMDDNQFWDTYFKLMKNELPKISSTWKEGDRLPRPYSESKQEAAPLDFLEDQFKSFGKKASSAVIRAGTSAGVDMSKILSAMDLADKANSADQTEEDNERERCDYGNQQQKQTLLDVDPDLEEYLGDMYNGDDNDGGDDIEDNVEDSDLDDYLNELTKSPRKEEDEDQFEDDLNDEDLEALIQSVGD